MAFIWLLLLLLGIISATAIGNAKIHHHKGAPRLTHRGPALKRLHEQDELEEWERDNLNL